MKIIVLLLLATISFQSLAEVKFYVLKKKYRNAYTGVSMHECFQLNINGGMHPSVNGRIWTDRKNRKNQMCDNYSVYTTTEVNSLISTTKTNLETSINTKLNAKFGEITKAINSIPAEIAKEETVKRMKDEIIQKLMKRIDSLEARIEELESK